MNKNIWAALVIAALTVSVGAASAQEQDDTDNPTTDAPTVNGLLQCASGCKKTFYFSEESDPAFATLRNACIEGCGAVPDAHLQDYQRCYDGCRDVFPFRHSERSELAGFQKSCILACGNVR
ncbi:MAG: hypothetical protein OET44_08895 [Gammaproteobacteria bacterium]|nr:hypothetical protein [Gammaproteobacteria bacterium]